MEPRYNEGPRNWQNLFAVTRSRYIEVHFHTVYYYWGKENLSLYRGLCYIEVRYIEVPLYRLATVDCMSTERARDARKASEFLARALSTILLRSSVEVFFVLISGILLKFKLEIWTRMCKLTSECKYHFVLLEIMRFFSLKTCSFGAKLCWQQMPKWCFACFESFYKSFLTCGKLEVHRRYGRLKRVK